MTFIVAVVVIFAFVKIDKKKNTRRTTISKKNHSVHNISLTRLRLKYIIDIRCSSES